MQRTKSQYAILICLFTLASGLVMVRPALAAGPKQEGYPPPAEATPETPLLEEPLSQPTLQPYPPAGAGLDGLIPLPIGSQGEEGATGASPSAGTVGAQQGDNRGILFLWLGFFATLLIFLTSVIGAIVLFTRRNEA